jgi:gamma-D-glutamyl-L-lysine dipeptidyl-peptidase
MMMDPLARDIDDLRRRWVPDRRLGVFDVEIAVADATGGEGAGAPRRLSGRTTSRDALAALRRLASEAGLVAEVTALPDASVDGAAVAVCTAAIAPLLQQPLLSAARVSEALHGEALTVLERRDQWLRVRAGDGYLGWLHAGYTATGPEDWAADWAARATGRSLGAEIRTDDGRLRLPLGARASLRGDGTIELADGQAGVLVSGAVRPEGEVRAEARMLAMPELALRWFGGAPYLWGGRTEWGIDCSGLAQSVYAARGIGLLRDSDQQVGQGRDVPLADGGAGYEAGDLLFFTERGRVSHVALWAGAGRIVHSALSRGGVGSDGLFEDTPLARRLRDNLVAVRRPA